MMLGSFRLHKAKYLLSPFHLFFPPKAGHRNKFLFTQGGTQKLIFLAFLTWRHHKFSDLPCWIDQKTHIPGRVLPHTREEGKLPRGAKKNLKRHALLVSYLFFCTRVYLLLSKHISTHFYTCFNHAYVMKHPIKTQKDEGSESFWTHSSTGRVVYPNSTGMKVPILRTLQTLPHISLLLAVIKYPLW